MRLNNKFFAIGLFSNRENGPEFQRRILFVPQLQRFPWIPVPNFSTVHLLHYMQTDIANKPVFQIRIRFKIIRIEIEAVYNC